MGDVPIAEIAGELRRLVENVYSSVYFVADCGLDKVGKPLHSQDIVAVICHA
jgi:hypothetical protein